MTYEELLDQATEHAVVAKVSYDLYWIYWEKRSRENYFEALDDYSEFFRFDQHAHLVTFVVALMRLFDRDARSNGFSTLLGQRPNAQASARSVALEPIVNKVRLLRNKVMAHADRTKSAQDWFAEANVTYNELRDLGDGALEIVNILRAANGNAPAEWHDLHVQHLKALLDKLLAHRRYD